MKRKLGINFELNFNEIIQANKSFKKAKCAIAYAGKNRNRSYISKETFEAALPSIKNIPLVGNYDIEKNQLGSHDLRIVTDSEGQAKLINATVPFGVVPESANQWWEEVNGIDYLWTDVLLWDRSPITEFVVNNRKVAQSMEINVFDDKYEILEDGVCKINEFQFEALCAIGVEPCFESANIQIAQNYVLSDYAKQFSMLLNDLKEFNEEGEIDLKKKNSVDTDDILKVTENSDTRNEDTNLEKNQDSPNVDKKEMNENSETQTGASANEQSEDESSSSEFELLQNEFEKYKSTHSHTNEEYQSLLDFKTQTEARIHNEEIDDVLEQFSAYSSLSEFEDLKKIAYGLNKSDVEEKCFAIKGRHSEIVDKKIAPKLVVDKKPVNNKNPYGNIFD